MERKDSGCYEAPRKLGLSFSIEEILKRPAERSDGGRREGAGGRGTGQAAAAGSRLERPPQDQPQGKCLLVISYPFLSLHDPAGLLCGDRERALKSRDARHGAGPSISFYLAQKCGCSDATPGSVSCGMQGRGPVLQPGPRENAAARYLLSIHDVTGTARRLCVPPI